MPLFLLANWKWIAAALGGVALTALGAYGASLHYRVVISEMQAVAASQRADATALALAQFTADADKIHESADAYTALQAGLDTRFNDISKDFHNAVKSHPLPVDCRADPERLRTLTAAVKAANTAAGFSPGPAVPPAQ